MREVVLPPPPIAEALRLASSTQEDLRTLRAAGLPQQEIRRQLGVGRMSLYRWENGTHSPMTPEVWHTIHLWAERVRHSQQSSSS